MRLHALPGMSWVEDLKDGGDPSCVPSQQPPPAVATLDFDGVRAALAPPTPLTAAEVEAYSNTHKSFHDAALRRRGLSQVSDDDEAKAAKLKARAVSTSLGPSRPTRPL